MLSLRLSLEGEPTFARLLGDVRERVLRTYEYQEMPFEKLVEELEPERSLSHTPLFQAIFQIENRMRNAVGIKGLGLEVMHADSGSSRFDLGLMVAEADREIIALMEYRTELFDSPS